MTTDIKELSKQAAEVLGVPAKVAVYAGWNTKIETTLLDELWLAEDSGRCADIAADRMINIEHYESSVHAVWKPKKDCIDILFVNLANHNGDRKAAQRVAVLKAVIEQGME